MSNLTTKLTVFNRIMVKANEMHGIIKRIRLHAPLKNKNALNAPTPSNKKIFISFRIANGNIPADMMIPIKEIREIKESRAL